MSANQLMYEKYTHNRRHWSRHCEAYTGGDSLVTALRDGWRLEGVAYRQNILLNGSRHTLVYHFELYRNGYYIAMAVIGNPYIERLIRKYDIRVIDDDVLQPPHEEPDIIEPAVAV